MRTQLYRHFDKEDNLLYVGISFSSLLRLSQHKSLSSWYGQISRVTIENFENREQALEAETKAILNEKPKYNVQKSNVVEKIKENRSRNRFYKSN
mgnify:CR=1 FL=1